MGADLIHSATQVAGISFDPAIRGILVVLVGVVALMGSVYLLLGTNVGARLGFLLSAGGLFGWMTILGVTWWLIPPAIGPRGELPVWTVTDIVRGDPAGADEAIIHDLPNTCWSSLSLDCEPVGDGVTVASEILAANPELVAEVGEDGTLSEIDSIDPEAVADLDFGSWELVSAADAGEALAAADEELKAEEIFVAATEYLVLDSFDQGGKTPLPDDPSRLDRIQNKIETTLQLTSPTHYAVVQLIPVVPQVPAAGEAPPPPVADIEQPVISVVMVRDLGTRRLPGALVTLGSGAMLGVTCYALHRRDKLADAHRSEA
jgi:hypothetical protein